MPLRKPRPFGVSRTESVSQDTGRRPTLPTIRTTAPPQPALGPLMASDAIINSPSSSPRSGNSFSHDVNHDALIKGHEEEEQDETLPFSTLEALCKEAGEQYPPPSLSRTPSVWSIRQGYISDNQYNLAVTHVQDWGHDTPSISIHEGMMDTPPTFCEEKSLTKLKRRASSVSNSVGGLKRKLWSTSGSLKRKVGRGLGIQQAQEVARIENGQRARFMDAEITDNETDNGMVVWKRMEYEI